MEKDFKSLGQRLSIEATSRPVKATAQYMAERLKINLRGYGRFLKVGGAAAAGAAAADQNNAELDALTDGWEGRD